MGSVNDKKQVVNGYRARTKLVLSFIESGNGGFKVDNAFAMINNG